MVDLILAVIGLVYMPVVAIASCCALVMIIVTIFQRRGFRWYFLIRALLATLFIETAFVLVGGSAIAFAFGKSLGYGLPVVVCLITLLVGICSFFWLHPVRKQPLTGE